ncbi:MAG: hypothetical protein HIU90_11000 [Proteobacteria bacterium]|nr:hypothetical protein [Pseudomonadota bacterium]
MIAFGYLVLVLVLAVTLNVGNRFVRALGTAVAALGLVMMVSSIILADFDGTFVPIMARADLVGRFGPLVLNTQAAVGTAGVLFLPWAAWRQVLRRVVMPVPSFNSSAGFGRVWR